MASMAFALAVCGSAHATQMSDVISGQHYDEATQVAAAGSFAGFANIDRQRAVANLVDSSRGSLLPALGAINPTLAAAPASSTKTFLTQAIAGLGATDAAATAAAAHDLPILSGAYAAGAAQVGLHTVNAIGGSGGVIARRQEALMAERKSYDAFCDNGAFASILMNQNFANRIWASPFYTHQEMDDKDGYDGYTYKGWGVSVGYDRACGDLVFGASFTYSRGDYEQNNLRSDNTIDNYGFSLYGQYYNSSSGFFTTLAGGYNYGDNDWANFSALGSGWVNANNHTASWWLGGDIGWDYQLSENLTLTPTIGLFWTEARGSSYATSGAVVQHFDRIKQKALLMPISVSATYRHQIDECSSINFRVTGGYAYNFKNDRAEGSFTYAGYENQPIFIQGVKPGRHTWNIGAGITYQMNKVDFGVDYRYDGASKFNAHRVAATVGLSF